MSAIFREANGTAILLLALVLISFCLVSVTGCGEKRPQSEY